MANEIIYCAMGMHEDVSGPATPSVRYFTDRNEAERQYCLYRAAAATSSYPRDTAVLMTTEGFVLESKSYTHEPAPAPEEEEPEG
ncbi:MAG: hypothetical protein IKD79_00510 [Oscillospiraceae bacterium]|nr:hypothetical protein [Oscillospiraceae bacterium]